MKHHLYFIEGLPGTGKTTRAEKLAGELAAQGLKVFPIRECEKNPLDLARCAILTEAEFQMLRKSLGAEKESSLAVKLEAASEHAEGSVYVFYPALFGNPELTAIAMKLRSRDVYNGHYSFETFRREHLKRWQSFAASADAEKTAYIADAILLQSPLFELMGYYELSPEDIFQYISELLSQVQKLSPVVSYTRVTDVPAAMGNICAIRKREGDRWEKGIYQWMENAPYCRHRNYHGFDGLCAFMKDRQNLELQILEKRKIPYEIFDYHADFCRMEDN